MVDKLFATNKADRVDMLTKPLVGSALYLGYISIVGGTPVASAFIPALGFGATLAVSDAIERFGVDPLFRYVGIFSKEDELIQRTFDMTIGEALITGLTYPFINALIQRQAPSMRMYSQEAYFGFALALAADSGNNVLQDLLVPSGTR